MIEGWLERKIRAERDEHESRVVGILAHAHRMEKGARQITEKIPAVSRILKQDSYKVEFAKSSRTARDGDLTELWSVVTINEEVYYVSYSTENYPTIDIKRGFTIHICTRPEIYLYPLDLYFKPEIWAEVGEENPIFKDVAGLSLYGNLAVLTEVGGQKDLTLALDLLDGQTRKSP